MRAPPRSQAGRGRGDASSATRCCASWSEARRHVPVDTFHAGTTATLIPRVLDWSLGASYSYALGRVDTRNPIPPTSGTAAQRANATARPFPAFEDALLRLDTALKYHFSKVWTARLGYVFESFEKHDWRTDHLNPFVPVVTAIWLGNDQKNYTAHIVGVTLGYRFK